MNTFDLIVVGAGVVGSATATHAAKCNATVMLLEQYHFLHRRGSSHGESRITRLTYPSDTYTSLTRRSHESWRALERETGETLFTTTGGIDILDRDSPTAESFVGSCARNGIPLRELSLDNLEEFGLRPRPGTISFWQPESGVLRATSAVSALQRLAATHGAVLRDSCEVVSLVDGYDAAGQRTVNVVSRDGRQWTARRVVLALGAWSGPTLQNLCGLHINLSVVQTTVMYFGPNNDYLSPRGSTAGRLLANQPVIVDYGSGGVWMSSSMDSVTERSPVIYSCPSSEFPGLTKFAVHDGTVTTASTRTFTPDIKLTVEPVSRWLQKHVPFVSPVPVLAETCLYTNTPDEDFVVDVHPVRPHIIVAAGFSGHGFKFGPLIGQAAAELALTGASSIDLSAFRLSRPSLGLKYVESGSSGSPSLHAKL